MRAIISRDHFLAALAHSRSIATKRVTVPSLSNVLLRFSENKLELSSTDLEIASVRVVPAQVTLGGAIIIPAHTLYSVVRKVHESMVILELESDNKIILRTETGRYKFSLSCLPPDNFPELPRQNLPYKLTLQSRTLHNMLARISFAMSLDETRYYLNGTYLHQSTEKEISGVATDGYRLAIVKAPIPQGMQPFPGIILARKTVNCVLAMLAELDLETDIQISLSETQVSFVFPDTFLTSRLVNGSFPDYSHVIPKSSSKKMVVDTNVLIQSVERVSTVLAEKTRWVKFSLSQGTLILSSEDSGIGSAREEMEVDYHGDPIEIGFNVSYLAEIVHQIKGKTAEFFLNSPTSAVIIKAIEEQDTLFLLMPMRV